MDTTRTHTNPHSYGIKRLFSTLEDIKEKKITVMGLGLHGGGEATTRFFLKHGAHVTVTDMKTEEELKTSVDSLMNDSSLDTSRLSFVLGEHRLEDFKNADCVIKNPIVKYDGNKYLACAKHIESDISIFLQFTKSKIIAVTGSKGKSSTVSAIHYGLNEAGIKTLLGGNITVSPLTFIDKTLGDKPPLVVLELSSWQLADLRGRKLLKPIISIITKIVPDHQNWYGNMESYVQDKKLIYADQDEKDVFLCSCDEEGWGDVFAKEAKANIIRYPDDIPESLLYGEGEYGDWLDDLKVPGEHNKENVLNAACVMSLVGIQDDDIIDILKKYTGIGHRLEYFHTWKKERCEYMFYNDSAATVPESVVAALDSFPNGLHLITGGTDKELDFSPLVNKLIEVTGVSLQSIFLLAGTGTDKLLALLKKEKVAIDYFGPYNSVEELLKEVKDFLEKKQYSETQNIVFSPGATSFGMFKNEFDRGDTFKRCVLEVFI